MIGVINPSLSFAILACTILIGFYLSTRKKSFAEKIVAHLERTAHFDELPLKGVIFYLVGASLTITFFEFVPAICGVVILAVVDSVGTMYGKYVGRFRIPWNKDKHIEGPIIGGLLAAVLCIALVTPAPAFAGSYVGAFVDTIKLKWGRFSIDDNLLIPVISAAVIQWML